MPNNAAARAKWWQALPPSCGVAQAGPAALCTHRSACAVRPAHRTALLEALLLGLRRPGSRPGGGPSRPPWLGRPRPAGRRGCPRHDPTWVCGSSAAARDPAVRCSRAVFLRHGCGGPAQPLERCRCVEAPQLSRVAPRTTRLERVRPQALLRLACCVLRARPLDACSAGFQWPGQMLPCFTQLQSQLNAPWFIGSKAVPVATPWQPPPAAAVPPPCHPLPQLRSLLGPAAQGLHHLWMPLPRACPSFWWASRAAAVPA